MFNSQCSILIRILSEQREAARVRAVLRLRIEHWELNIGQILGSDAEQWILPSYFCASPWKGKGTL